MCLSVCLSGTKGSKALNLHLSLFGQSQVSLRSVSGQSEVSLRSVSGQSQVSPRSVSGLSVPTSSVRTEPKILRLVLVSVTIKTIVDLMLITFILCFISMN